MAGFPRKMREPFALDGDPLAYADGDTLRVAVPVRYGDRKATETLSIEAFVALAAEIAKNEPGQRDKGGPSARDARTYSLTTVEADEEGDDGQTVRAGSVRATAAAVDPRGKGGAGRAVDG